MTSYVNDPIDPVYKMLFEKRRTKRGNIVVSNIKGRIPKGMKPAEPEDVFKNLKINETFTGPILESVKKLIDLSRKTTPAMNEAYGSSKIIEDRKGEKGLLIDATNIDRPNATRYMSLLIDNAFKADVIRSNDDIRVENTNGGVLVFASRGGRVKWLV